MLVIRQEQINRLIMGSDEEFAEYLIAQVKLHHPEIEFERDDETLRKMVGSGVRRARGYALSNAEDIKAFVLIMFDIAPNFDEQIQIRAVLEDEKIAPGRRIENVRSPIVPVEAWEEAKNNYDENAWFSDQPKSKDKSDTKREKRVKTAK